jgi:hypothetical protein
VPWQKNEIQGDRGPVAETRSFPSSFSMQYLKPWLSAAQAACNFVAIVARIACSFAALAASTESTSAHLDAATLTGIRAFTYARCHTTLCVHMQKHTRVRLGEDKVIPSRAETLRSYCLQCRAVLTNFLEPPSVY